MGKIVFESDNSQGLLILEEDLSIQDAPLLKKALEDSSRNCNRLKIRMEDVTGADLSTLQLLVSVRKSFKAAGKEIIPDGTIPQVITDLINDAGYSHQMTWLKNNG